MKRRWRDIVRRDFWVAAISRTITLPWRVLRWLMLTRPIRFTRFGMLYVLFTVGTGAAAINTGNNLLYLILGILLGFIVVSGFLSDSGLWGVRAAWHPAENCYAGLPAAFVCRVEKGWFPAVGVTVRAEWSSAPATPVLFHWVRAHGAVERTVRVTPPRRGWFSLERLRYATEFPFGLFEKFHLESRADRWLVYPRVERLSLRGSALDNRRALYRPAARSGLGAIPYVLRNFREGDAANRIHWKLSAKRRELIVNEMEEESDQGDLLYVARWPANLSRDEEDRMVSFVASLAFSFYEDDRPVGLLTPGASFEPDHSRAHLDRLLRYLALVDPAGENSAGRRSADAPRGPAIDVLELWKERTHA